MRFTKREKNSIHVFDLADPSVVSNLAHDLREAKECGYTEIEIKFVEIKSVFPNCAAPIAALIDFEKGRGVTFNLMDGSQYVESLRLDSTKPVCDAVPANVLNTVWYFSEGHNLNEFTKVLRQEITERLRFAEGVLWGLDWALYEVADNVLMHSSSGKGFIMAQVHPNAVPPRIVVCIADQGIGLRLSLQASYPNKIRDDRTAIGWALMKGVTRDKLIGQGNGLWGLREIVAKNRGRLVVGSGDEVLSLDAASVQAEGLSFQKRQFLTWQNPGTTIDFQLIADHPLDIKKTLQFPNTINTGFQYNSLLDDRDRFTILVAEGPGTGTRFAGERLRQKCQNALAEGAAAILIDFAGVGVATSSFSDEFIGKLVVEMGFVEYANRIQLINTDSLISSVIQRAVSQRLFANLTGTDILLEDQ